MKTVFLLNITCDIKICSVGTSFNCLIFLFSKIFNITEYWLYLVLYFLYLVGFLFFFLISRFLCLKDLILWFLFWSFILPSLCSKNISHFPLFHFTSSFLIYFIFPFSFIQNFFSLPIAFMFCLPSFSPFLLNPSIYCFSS